MEAVAVGIGSRSLDSWLVARVSTTMVMVMVMVRYLKYLPYVWNGYKRDFFVPLEKFRRTYQWIAMMKIIILLMLSMGHEIIWLARYEGLKVVFNP